MYNVFLAFWWNDNYYDNKDDEEVQQQQEKEPNLQLSPNISNYEEKCKTGDHYCLKPAEKLSNDHDNNVTFYDTDVHTTEKRHSPDLLLVNLGTDDPTSNSNIRDSNEKQLSVSLKNMNTNNDGNNNNKNNRMIINKESRDDDDNNEVKKKKKKIFSLLLLLQ